MFTINPLIVPLPPPPFHLDNKANINPAWFSWALAELNNIKLAMLSLFNAIKKEQKLPKFMQYANITTIYKKKGSRQEMNNDRGIFVVSTMRMILDSLIYNEKYPLVDSRMSDSNIGARKNRNIRDHLYIVYAIINSVIHGNEEPVDIQIYNVENCFNALWLEDCMLDLYETLPAQASSNIQDEH